MKKHHAPEIDWQKQWELFAPGFQDGIAQIDLAPYSGKNCPPLLLQAGAGFGDLSHPTTQMMLQLMAPYIKNAQVIDIGCGSGILSLAAAMLGAHSVFGIDIDPQALQHAAQNCKINNLQNPPKFAKQVPSNFFTDRPLIILMNMIFSEQRQAWQSQQLLHSREAIIIISGILSSQKNPYLPWTQQLGWSLKQECASEEWASFVFSQNAKL